MGYFWHRRTEASLVLINQESLVIKRIDKSKDYRLLRGRFKFDDDFKPRFPVDVPICILVSILVELFRANHVIILNFEDDRRLRFLGIIKTL